MNHSIMKISTASTTLNTLTPITLLVVLNSVVSPIPPSILFWIMGRLFLLGEAQKATRLIIALGAKPAIILNRPGISGGQLA